MNPHPDRELAFAMRAVARELLGEPNARLSSKTELRFGNQGSLCVDLVKGVWHDHEAEVGGGVLDLIRAKTGMLNGAALTWLEERGFVSAQPGAAPDRKRRIVATYPYADVDGRLLYEVVRFDPKDFRQRRPDGSSKDGWTWNMDGVARVPYRLPELLEAIGNGELVFIAEGEKAVGALVALGMYATCFPGGANKWRLEYAEHFNGADVVLLPDNDDTGRKHARTVAAALAGHARRVRVLELPGLAPKADVFDWIAAGGTAEQLEALAQAGSSDMPCSDPGAAEPPLRTVGKLRLLSVDDALNAPTRSYILEGLLAPGEMSVWWGRPKCGKSFLLLRLAYGLAQGRGMWGRDASQIPVLYVAAEGEGGIKGRIRALYDALGTAPNFIFIAQRVDLFDPDADLADMLAAAGAVGAGLVVVDTLARTMGAGDENKAQDMNAFVSNLDRIREEVSTKPHVAVIHHGGWDGSHARGSIALVGAADLVVKVEGEQGSSKTVTVEYAKDDAGADVLGFKLDVVSLPPDARGRSRATCLAAEEEKATTESTSKGHSLTAEELGWFRDIQSFFDHPTNGQQGVRPFPEMPPIRGATRDEIRSWLQTVGRLDVAPGVALPATERSRLLRYLNRLKDKGKIGLTDHWVWLP